VKIGTEQYEDVEVEGGGPHSILMPLFPPSNGFYHFSAFKKNWSNPKLTIQASNEHFHIIKRIGKDSILKSFMLKKGVLTYWYTKQSLFLYHFNNTWLQLDFFETCSHLEIWWKLAHSPLGLFC